HEVSAANWPQLSLATAVAICDALALELNPKSEIRNPKSATRLAIKWPNDIILDGAKLAGILIESPGGRVPAKARLIIGVGINVNNSWREPEATAAGLARHREKPVGAITLCDATSHQHDTKQMLVSILRALETRITQLANNDQQLPAAWQQL